MRIIIALFLLFFSVNFAGAKELKLAGGELEIDEWGLYTMIHRYSYPTKPENILFKALYAMNPSYKWLNERPAVLVIGVMPAAEPGYYLLLNKFIRESCDSIIYAGPRQVPMEIAVGELSAVSEAIDMMLPVQFLMKSSGGFREANAALDQYEGSWFYPDNVRNFYQWQKFWRNVSELIRQLPQKETEKLISHSQTLLNKWMTEQTVKENYINWIKLVTLTYGGMLQPIRDFMFQQRIELSLEVFDNLYSLKAQKSENFCFMTPPYNVATIKQLLEKRGFTFQYTKRFPAVSFN